MQAALALLPCTAVLVAILGLGWNGLAAAALSALLAAALWLLAAFAPWQSDALARAVPDALLLTFLVACMVAPGLLFVEATRRMRAEAAIADFVRSLQLPPARAAILIAAGLGIVVETLTGMGVSLLVTVPLLLALTERWRAIGIALVGMSLMPWGALAISAHVGAKLAGLSIEELAKAIWWQSGPIAALLPVLAAAFMPVRQRGDVTVAVVSGLILSATIAVVSMSVGIEIASVFGGLALTAFVACGARSGNGWWRGLAAPALRPYAVLIAAVLVQKLAIYGLGRLGLSALLSTGRVHFDVLTSPGVALLAATLLSARGAIDGSALAAIVQKLWRPLATVALFMVTARLLVESGGIGVLAGALSGLGGSAAIVAVALLGAIGGFITGSGITGNALFMPGAAAVGLSLGDLPLFAALQNCAAGHAAMASLPVASILLAALPTRSSADDRTAMLLGLGLAGLYTLVLIGTAMLLFHVKQSATI